MIIDAFTYFNEPKELLDIRFNTLHKHVDYFLVMEGNRTHSGNKKDINFNVENFPEFRHRIIHSVVEMPELLPYQTRWYLENYQRNAISDLLSKYIDNRGYIIIGDVDEIPDLRSWTGGEGVFSGPAYYYKLNKFYGMWNGSCIISRWRFNSIYGIIRAQDVRNFRDLLNTVGRGWHFSFLGDVETKIRNFAHSELDKPDLKVNTDYHPADGRKLQTVAIDSAFPEYIINNINKLNNLIEPIKPQK